MIELQEVTKNFGDVAAIRGLSCTFPENRVVGIIGANGSGKTTMMRLISSIMRPTSGKILVNQIDTAVQPHEIKKEIGFMLGGDTALFPRLTAKENIIFWARLQGMNRKEAAERTEQLKYALHMEDFFDRCIDGFSRGMRQKVLFAQTIVHAPKILLLDEPSTGLDIFTVLEIQKMIKNYKKQAGTSILISSHNMDELENLCDDIMIINKGEKMFLGSKEDLLKEHRTHRIADAFEITVAKEVSTCNDAL